MFHKKRRNLFFVVFAMIMVLFVAVPAFSKNFTELNQIKNKQVTSVGFAGEDQNEVFYVYPDEQAEEFISMLKNAKLSGFPTGKFQGYKGGAPAFTTRIIFEDNGSIDISYMKAEDNTYLIVNGKGYICDAQTIEKYSTINNECEELFKAN